MQVMTLTELRAMPYKALTLSPAWQAFLGNVPASGRFNILVAGPSGTGKSVFCLGLAKEFSRHGDVLYVCAEESTKAGTVQIRARLMKIRSSRILMCETTRYDDVRRALRTYGCRFCFIDSIQELDVDNKVVQDLMNEFPDVIFIFVAQVDWTEKHSLGSSTWRHRVDIRLWTEVDPDGTRYVRTIKSRYAPTEPRMRLFAPSRGTTKEATPRSTYDTLVDDARKRGSRIWKYG